MPESRPRLAPAALLLLLSGLLWAAWWWPDRPVAAGLAMPSAKFSSVSFSAYRRHESPLTRTFPTAREVDEDLALIASRSNGIRTYSALEGAYDLPALAAAHGLKMWQGIWLGPDRAQNDAEIAAGIRLANAHPDVIQRVVVGNEVLLRKDLPPDELIADIERVRRAIHQPVTYADVWNFFLDHPEIVPHLDVVSIHILPYWEDDPTNIAGAMAHVRDVLALMHRRFPNAQIAIGETGWPSRGRWRRDAAPSVVNEAVYLRRFISLAAAEHIDYNLFEAFDEVWKYHNEGVIGASWGLWTADRTPKFPLTGPVSENPDWPVPAALSIVCGWLFYLQAILGFAHPVRPRLLIATTAMALGGALGFAWAGTAPVLFDRFALIAGAANLAGQTVLALLFMQRLGRRFAGIAQPPARTGRDATDAVRSLLRGRRPDGWRGASWHDAVFDDLGFTFVWACAVVQVLLAYDPRYRDFPLAAFIVPGVLVVARIALNDLPRRGGGREELAAGVVLIAGAFASAIQEGKLNTQSLVWNACALVLALPPLLRARVALA